MKRKLSLLLCVTILFSLFTLVAKAEESKTLELYVAVDGSDTNTGTKESPLATVAKARDVLREKRQKGELTNGATVYIREGIYSVLEQIKLEAQDSGTEENPIVYAAYPGEEVKFVGGVSKQLKEFSDITDQSVLAKIAPEAEGKVKVYDLASLNIELPEQVWIGTYSYYKMMGVITGKNGGAASPEVFVNNQAMTLSRYPNEGSLTIAKIIEPGANPRLWEDDKKNDPAYVPEGDGRVPTPFTIQPNDKSHISRWQSADDALLYGRWAYDWAGQTMPLGSVDVNAGTITSEYPSYYSVVVNQDFYIYNLLEELDIPGEYYIDRIAKKLYFYPLASMKGNDYVTLSLLEKDMWRFEGASHIKIKNIDMDAMRSKAVYAKDGEGIEIYGCEISNTAGVAVTMENMKKSGVKSCYFHDVNGGARLTGGDRETLTPGENYVENCHFYRYSRINKTYTWAISIDGVGNRAEYNEIHEGEHMALMYTGNNNIVAYNEIYNVCTDTDDMGAIYVGKTMVDRGNKVMYNYIHDVGTEGGGRVHGIYLDDGYSGGLVFGNVVENATGYGVHLTGQDAIVYNNMFINVDETMVYMDYRTVTDNSGINPYIELQKTVDESPWVTSELWLKTYPELSNVQENVKANPFNRNNLISGNLAVNSPGVKVNANNTGNTWGKEENTYRTTKDPGFYDMKARNYLLKEDSEVYEEIPGFQPIPFTRIGRYDDRAENRVKDAVTLVIGSPRAFIGNELTFIDETNDAVVPVLNNSVTYVPIRFISEALGAEVGYDDNTATASITMGTDKLDIKVGDAKALKNGEEIDMEVTPLMMQNRMFIPLRKVTELLDRRVTWDECGLITISNTENLLGAENDSELIEHLYLQLKTW